MNISKYFIGRIVSFHFAGTSTTYSTPMDTEHKSEASAIKHTQEHLGTPEGKRLVKHVTSELNAFIEHYRKEFPTHEAFSCIELDTFLNWRNLHQMNVVISDVFSRLMNEFCTLQGLNDHTTSTPFSRLAVNVILYTNEQDYFREDSTTYGAIFREAFLEWVEQEISTWN